MSSSQVVGKYRLLERIGQGAMGEVYNFIAGTMIEAMLSPAV